MYCITLPCDISIHAAYAHTKYLIRFETSNYYFRRVRRRKSISRRIAERHERNSTTCDTSSDNFHAIFPTRACVVWYVMFAVGSERFGFRGKRKKNSIHRALPRSVTAIIISNGTDKLFSSERRTIRNRREHAAHILYVREQGHVYSMWREKKIHVLICCARRRFSPMHTPKAGRTRVRHHRRSHGRGTGGRGGNIASWYDVRLYVARTVPGRHTVWCKWSSPLSARAVQ